MTRRTALAAAYLAVLSGCVTYQPHVLNPVASEAALRARSVPGVPLDLPALTTIALRNSSELEVTRARVAVADAALVTARQRINPSVTGEGGYNRTPDSVATYSVSPTFTIETAGKRGYRILAAEKTAEASRIALYEAEWHVRSAVRKALDAHGAAVQKLTLLEAENAVRAEIVEIYTRRVALGEASKPELEAARAEQASLAASLREAEGGVAAGLANIAASIGVAVGSLESSVFVYPELPQTPSATGLQKAGLLHRADIRKALVQYEVADATLRLEIANQYPNISLNPAYTFQEGFPAYTLGTVLESLPVFHRRQGQIAEAEAERHQVETEFLALQSKVIAETSLAERQFASAIAEWRSARDLLEPIEQQREDAVLSAFKAGERDRLDLAQARLLTLAAKGTTLDALARAQTAFAALEDALQAEVTQ